MEDQVTETLRQAIHAAALAEAAKYAGSAWTKVVEHAPVCDCCNGAGFVTVQKRKFKSRPPTPTRHTCRECKGYGVNLEAALAELGLVPKYQRPDPKLRQRSRPQAQVVQEAQAPEASVPALRFRPLEMRGDL